MNQETHPLFKETILILILLFFSLTNSIFINLEWGPYHLNCFSFIFTGSYLLLFLFKNRFVKLLPYVLFLTLTLELIFHSVISGFVLGPSIYSFNFLYLLIFIFFDPFKNIKVLSLSTLIIGFAIILSFIIHKISGYSLTDPNNRLIYFVINGFIQQVALIIFFIFFYDYGDIAMDFHDRKFSHFDVAKVKKYLYLILAISFFYGSIFYAINFQPLFYCNLTYALVTLALTFFFDKIKSYHLSISLLQFTAHLLLTSHIFFSGGVYSPSLYFYLLLPISAFFLQGRKYAYIWTFLCFESHLFISIMTYFGVIRFQIPEFVRFSTIPLTYSLGILFCFYFFIKHQFKKENFS